MANIAYRRKRKNNTGSYDTVYYETDSTIVLRPNGETVETTLARCITCEDASDTVPPFKIDADYLNGKTSEEIIEEAVGSVKPYTHPQEKQCSYSYTHPTDIQCNAKTEIESLKSSVSNGKALVASAITDRGVTTAADATFQQMADNIRAIVARTYPLLVASGSEGTGNDVITNNCDYCEISMQRSGGGSIYPIIDNGSFTIMRGQRIYYGIRYGDNSDWTCYVTLSSDGNILHISRASYIIRCIYKAYVQ